MDSLWCHEKFPFRLCFCAAVWSPQYCTSVLIAYRQIRYSWKPHQVAPTSAWSDLPQDSDICGVASSLWCPTCPRAPVSVSSLLPALLHTFPFMSTWDVLQVTMCSRIVRADASVYILLAGIFFVLPCIESYTKVDLRTVSFDVPPQEVRLLLSTTDTSAILRIHTTDTSAIRMVADIPELTHQKTVPLWCRNVSYKLYTFDIENRIWIKNFNEIVEVT